ncbi:TonB-dependent siderophore receptor [Pseudomonas sp. zfem002]|uniref:TonB-dependent siderophore receptor n=1 Tax=Pseudomonas sp. zfem002 TaxID=3078197 RepID=UPI002928C8E8|nr:TonB-dependent siderophore receptor [Pseudomonas sp. zfem002]MDU9394761.1 TonB-dependent siderophore receptor [Pseudomonas sp. zfem002]
MLSGLPITVVRPTRSLRKKPLALAIVSASLALHTAVGAPLFAPASQARAESVEKTYGIPAGPLDAALIRFAGEAGVVVSFDTRMTAGHQSPALNGRFSVEQGFARLLQGSPFSVVRNADGSWSLLQTPGQGSVALAPTAVVGQGLAESGAAYTVQSATVGSKVATSLREVPHSVSVVTRQQIEEQNLNSLTEVMAKVTGVTLQKGGIAQASMGNESNFFSRGFAVSNTQIDGGAPLSTSIAGYGALSQLDMAQYERVEFLRGVDGLFSSSGDPGGTVNLVRKRALRDSRLAFSASAGSWDNYRSEFDLTGPLVDSGDIRGRLGMAYQDSKAFYDYGDLQNSLAYGSLEFDLSPDTTLTLGGSYQDVDGVPYFNGLPRYSNGEDLKLPRHTAFTSNWNRVREETRQAYARVEHSFAPDWSLTTELNWVDIDRNSSGLYYFGGVDPESGLGPAWYNYPNTGGSERKTLNSYFKGRFSAFGLEHDVLGGLDYTHTVGSVVQYTGVIANLPLDLGGRTPPADQGSRLNKDQYLTEIRKSLYGMTRLSLSEEVKFIIGGRLADYAYQNKQDFFDGETPPSRPSTKHESGVFTPYAGLTWDLDPRWTLYTSYAETFTPQTGYSMGPQPGSPLEPSTSKNYELGLKGQLFDGRMNSAFALYRIEQDGAAIEDGQYDFGGDCCYRNQGLVVSQGFDAEISGEVAPGLQLIAGYTYAHVVDKEGDEARDSFAGVTPKHLFKLWGTYQLPGQWQDWKVGLGATTQSRTSKNGYVTTFNPDSGKFDGEDVTYKFMQAGYTVWSGSIDYRIDEHWSATLNANNLADKRYYATVGTSAYNNFYGDPRNFMLTLRAKF